MPDLNQHPTVIRFYQRTNTKSTQPVRLDSAWLRQLCLDLGADDVGFVEIDRPELHDERAEILTLFPSTKTLISIVCRMNREPIRSPARSIANLEFHDRSDHTNGTAHAIVSALESRGIRALNPAGGFPMEVQNFPDKKTWIISHKPIAVAAGLGKMGIHRNVIHPKFGNFILLATVLVDAEMTELSQPIDYNPCLECKLCVSACPVGAISPDGEFNFSACFTHNYREFMGGFNDWVETIVDSKNSADYHEQVTVGETASMWQSLSYGANYKSAYCMAVCPAGDDVIAPFLTDRKQYLQDVVRPLQDKVETIYVTAGSDAEAHVLKRFPHKTVKRVGNGLRISTIGGFLRGLSTTFQPKTSAGLNCTYHFTFTGSEEVKATIIVRDQKLVIIEGHQETADIHIIADSRTWLRFVTHQTNIVRALVQRKIRVKGSPRLLVAFGKCFAN